MKNENPIGSLLRADGPRFAASIACTTWPVLPRVLAFQGREGLSELFGYTIELEWPSDLPFEPSDAVGDAATLVIEGDPTAPPHLLSGMLEEVEHTRDSGSVSFWRARIVPHFARLALSEHSRVFTDVSVPDIVSTILAQNGVAFERRLRDAYEPKAHVCQYRESDLAFVSRLLEREGIFYHFDHTPGGDVMVLGDASVALEPSHVEPIRYAASGTMGGSGFSHQGTVHALRAKQRAITSTVRVHDYDPMRPRLSVTGAAPVERGARGEVVRWGDHVLSPAEAARASRIRSEELAAARDRVEARSGVLGFRHGRRFSVSEHPHGAMNGEYLAVRVSIAGRPIDAPARILEVLDMKEVASQRSVFESRIEAMPAARAFRAPSATPMPRIGGVVTGVVDGAASSPYAQIDPEGRYRVSIHFDEGDASDGSRSTWIRMLQPHGGAPEGLHFPLRKETEVAIIFLGGDPDRPFILGVAPNPTKPSPVTQANHTKNVIQTGGANRLELEDAAGGQYITMSSPTQASSLHLGAGEKNFALKTDGRGRVYTGANLDVDVDVDKSEDVDATVTETYSSTHDLTVSGPVTELLKTSLDQTVGGPVTNTWTGPFTETVTGTVNETFGATLSTHVTGGLADITYNTSHTLDVGGSVTEKFTASQAITVNGDLSITVGGTVDETFADAKRHIKGTYDLDVSGTFKIDSPNLVATSPSFTVTVSDAFKAATDSFEVHGFHYEQHGKLMKMGNKKATYDGAYFSATGLSVTIALTITEKMGFKFTQTPLEDDLVIERGFQGGLLLITGGMDTTI